MRTKLAVFVVLLSFFSLIPVAGATTCAKEISVSYKKDEICYNDLNLSLNYTKNDRLIWISFEGKKNRKNVVKLEKNGGPELVGEEDRIIRFVMLRDILEIEGRRFFWPDVCRT